MTVGPVPPVSGTMRRVRATAAAFLVAALQAGAAFAVSNAPAPVSRNVLTPATTPAPLDLSALPPELGSLRLDGLVSRNADDLASRCAQLLPIARGATQDEPQRPGPELVLGLCARAAGDTVAAAEHFARMRERVAASLAPTGIWQGDAYYHAVGTLDIAAVAAALDTAQDSTVIASSLTAGNDGYRLHETLWLRDGSGRVRRVHVDVTPSAGRVMRHLAAQAGDPASRDIWIAMSAYQVVNLQAGQIAAESRALVSRARIALRTGEFGGPEQARKDLERAIAQDDAFARYVYAEWLISEGGDAAVRALGLLRAAAKQGLPEAQSLLALWCRQRTGCDRGEAAAAQAAAVRAYGEADVALLRYEAAQRLSLGDGARDLKLALAKGSTRALAVRLFQLAGAAGRREARERDALLQRGTAAQLAYAFETQGLLAYAQATNAAGRDVARATLERAAALGSARAAAQLGASFAVGDDADARRALPWHRLAAERGEPVGQYNYATSLLDGVGTEADPAAARLWYLRSALQGKASSFVALADLYASGNGVTTDTARAVSFYAAAARLGDARGQYRYALALELGDGVAQDREAARPWYERAAGQGVAEATVALARGELAGASSQAGMERLENCASHGVVPCRYALAEALVNGPASVRDVQRALAMHEAAAAANDARALNELGMLYLRGNGVAADAARGFGYLARCADLRGDGAEICLTNLGRAWIFALGTSADLQRARAVLEQAQALGSIDAVCVLGDLADRDGDAAESLRRYAAAAEAGSADCMRKYGNALLNGDDAQAPLALEWLFKAVAAGNAMARGEIVAALLQPESPLHDDAIGIAFAEQCVADAAYACIATAGGVLLRRDDPRVVARGVEWLERAARQGDKTTARVLGLAAYYGYGRPRDAAAARRWFTQAESSGLEAALLARLEAADGDLAAAQQRLSAAAARGNVHALLRLVDLCAEPAAGCGTDAPTTERWFADLERRGEARARGLLNDVVWAVATDPLATAAEAQRLIALVPRARYGLSEGSAERDSWAALLARAGRHAEACRLQRRVVADERLAKAKAYELRSYEQHRDAFCRGATWDAFD